MPTTGIDKLPYPNSGDIPDGPAAFLALSQRLSLMKGAGISYVADSAELGALITNGDAFTGLSVYHAGADVVVRFNGTAFKIAETKKFADVSAQGSWTTAYSGLLENRSMSLVLSTGVEYEYSGSAWVIQTSDSGWVYPTLTNGVATGANPFGYRRLIAAGVKVVYLRGRISGVSNGETMVTLPVGYRPDAGDDNVLLLDQSTQRVNFKSDGTIVALSTWGANSASFLGVNYVAV